MVGRRIDSPAYTHFGEVSLRNQQGSRLSCREAPPTMIGWTVGLRFLKAFTIIRIPLLRKGHENERNFRLSPF